MDAPKTRKVIPIKEALAYSHQFAEYLVHNTFTWDELAEEFDARLATIDKTRLVYVLKDNSSIECFIDHYGKYRTHEAQDLFAVLSGDTRKKNPFKQPRRTMQ